jgi:D-glycero-D-manno-heptose 1,7-bisphosphate phosphatase
MVKKAVFLDRDGTINTEKDYLYRPEDFAFIPGACQAVKLLNDAGFLVIVVTNQSGIARGYYDEGAVEGLHRHMDAELAKAGARVDAYYFCPHHPQHGGDRYGGECACRKPLPGMLVQAAADLAVDLGHSWMVGDKLADVEAGKRAGCRSLLVRTGYGREAEARLPRDVPAFDDLLEAVRAIIRMTGVAT